MLSFLNIFLLLFPFSFQAIFILQTLVNYFCMSSRLECFSLVYIELCKLKTLSLHQNKLSVTTSLLKTSFIYYLNFLSVLFIYSIIYVWKKTKKKFIIIIYVWKNTSYIKLTGHNFWFKSNLTRTQLDQIQIPSTPLLVSGHLEVTTSNPLRITCSCNILKMKFQKCFIYLL